MPKQRKRKQISSNTHPRTPMRHQIRLKPKRRVQDYLVSVSKTNQMVGAAKIEVNQVLGVKVDGGV